MEFPLAQIAVSDWPRRGRFAMRSQREREREGTIVREVRTGGWLHIWLIGFVFVIQ